MRFIDPHNKVKDKDRKKHFRDTIFDFILGLTAAGFIYNKTRKYNLFDLIDRTLGIGKYYKETPLLPEVNIPNITMTQAEWSYLVAKGQASSVGFDPDEAASYMGSLRENQWKNVKIGVERLEKRLTNIGAADYIDIARAESLKRFAESPAGAAFESLHGVEVTATSFDELLKVPQFLIIYRNVLRQKTREALRHTATRLRITRKPIRLHELFRERGLLLHDKLDTRTASFLEDVLFIAEGNRVDKPLLTHVIKNFQKEHNTTALDALIKLRKSGLDTSMLIEGVTDYYTGTTTPPNLLDERLSKLKLLRKLPADLDLSKYTKPELRKLAEEFLSGVGSSYRDLFALTPDNMQILLELPDFRRFIYLKSSGITPRVSPTDITEAAKHLSPIGSVIASPELSVNPKDLRGLDLSEALKKIERLYPEKTPELFRITNLTELVKVEPSVVPTSNYTYRQAVERTQKSIIQSITNWARTHDAPPVRIKFYAEPSTNSLTYVIQMGEKTYENTIHFALKNTQFKAGNGIHLQGTPIMTPARRFIDVDSYQIDLHARTLPRILDDLRDPQKSIDDVQKHASKLIDNHLLNKFPQIQYLNPKQMATPVYLEFADELFNKTNKSQFVYDLQETLEFIEKIKKNPTSKVIVLDFETLVLGKRPQRGDIPYSAGLSFFEVHTTKDGKIIPYVVPEKTTEIFADIRSEKYRALKEQLLKMGKSPQEAEQIINNIRTRGTDIRPSELVEKVIKRLAKEKDVLIIHKGLYERRVVEGMRDALDEETYKLALEIFRRRGINMDAILRVSQKTAYEHVTGYALESMINERVEKMLNGFVKTLGVEKQQHTALFDTLMEMAVLADRLNNSPLNDPDVIRDLKNYLDAALAAPTGKEYTNLVRELHNKFGVMAIGGSSRIHFRYYLDPAIWGYKGLPYLGVSPSVDFLGEYRRMERGLHQKKAMVMTELQARAYRRAFERQYTDYVRESLRKAVTREVNATEEAVGKFLRKFKTSPEFDPLRPSIDTLPSLIETSKAKKQIHRFLSGVEVAKPTVFATYFLEPEMKLGSGFVAPGSLPGYVQLPHPKVIKLKRPIEEALAEINMSDTVRAGLKVYLETYQKFAQHPEYADRAAELARKRTEEFIASLPKELRRLEGEVIYQHDELGKVLGEAGEMLYNTWVEQHGESTLIYIQTGRQRQLSFAHVPSGKFELTELPLTYFSEKGIPKGIVVSAAVPLLKKEYQDVLRIHFASIDTRLRIAEHSAKEAARTFERLGAEGIIDSQTAGKLKQQYEDLAQKLYQSRLDFVTGVASAAGYKVKGDIRRNILMDLADGLSAGRYSMTDLRIYGDGPALEALLKKGLERQGLSIEDIDQLLPDQLRLSWDQNELNKILSNLDEEGLDYLAMSYGIDISNIEWKNISELRDKLRKEISQRARFWTVTITPYGKQRPALITLEYLYHKEPIDMPGAVAAPEVAGLTSSKGLRIGPDVYYHVLDILASGKYENKTFEDLVRGALASDDSFRRFHGYVGKMFEYLTGQELDVIKTDNLEDLLAEMYRLHQDIVKHGTKGEWETFFKRARIFQVLGLAEGKNDLGYKFLRTGQEVPISIQDLAAALGIHGEYSERTLKNLLLLVGTEQQSLSSIPIPGLEELHPVIKQTVRATTTTGQYASTRLLRPLLRLGEEIAQAQELYSGTSVYEDAVQRAYTRYVAQVFKETLTPTSDSPLARLMTGFVPYYGGTVRSIPDVKARVIEILSHPENEYFDLALEYFGLDANHVQSVLAKEGVEGIRKVVDGLPQFADHMVIIPMRPYTKSADKHLMDYAIEEYLDVVVDKLTEEDIKKMIRGAPYLQGSYIRFPLRGVPVGVKVAFMPNALIGAPDEETNYIIHDIPTMIREEADEDGDISMLMMQESRADYEKVIESQRQITYATAKGELKKEVTIDASGKARTVYRLNTEAEREKLRKAMREINEEGFLHSILEARYSGRVPDEKTPIDFLELIGLIKQYAKEDVIEEEIQKRLAGVVGQMERRLWEPVRKAGLPRELATGMSFAIFDIVRGVSVHKQASATKIEDLIHQLESTFSTNQDIEIFGEHVEEILKQIYGDIGEQAITGFSVPELKEGFLAAFRYAKSHKKRSLFDVVGIEYLIRSQGNVGNPETMFNRLMDTLQSAPAGGVAASIHASLGESVREKVVKNAPKAVKPEDLVQAYRNLSKKAFYTHAGSEEFFMNLSRHIGNKTLQMMLAGLGAVLLVDFFTPNKLTKGIFDVGYVPGYRRDDIYRVDKHPELPASASIAGDDTFDFTTYIVKDALTPRQKMILRRLGIEANGTLRPPIPEDKREKSYVVQHVYG